MLSRSLLKKAGQRLNTSIIYGQRRGKWSFGREGEESSKGRFLFRSNLIKKEGRATRTKMLFYATLAGGLSGSVIYYLFRDQEQFIKDMLGAHERVPPLALHPKRGGLKNLPISDFYLDDTITSVTTEEDEEKPRLVILGSGWGAISVLKNLEKDKYNVTIISENNYFLFTPLLPSATVGTLELRSLIESVRKIASRIKAHFLEGKAVDIDLEHKLVEIKGINGEDNFYVPYDKLIVAVGATGITHGIEGLQHTVQLKTIRDAIHIRRKVTENVERACLPTTTPEERRRLLSFVICGGGPTGVEFAAELSDWINEDLVKWFPGLIREEVSIHIIQSRDHILNTFDSKISEYAEKRFQRAHVDVITNARVVRIDDEKVVYRLKTDEEDQTRKLPYGLCLWSTGIAMTSFARKLTDKLSAQAHKRVLTTDGYLHLAGVEDKSIYALGDCATIENPNLLEHLMDIFEEADTNKDGKIQLHEFLIICEKLRSRFPLIGEHLKNLERLFSNYDVDKNDSLDVDEMKTMLEDVDKKLTHLPATAQVASQQGKYLANYLNRLSKNKNDEESTERLVGQFHYNHLGALAYLGNTAVGDFKWGYQIIGGLWALYLWRSVYWSEQVSMRTRMNLSLDWTKCAIWGRDISTV
ncbi:uncharacterized protein BX663DRAFT_492830 [Cokeromyces recurvatus]|uniref:uncharacterized protein n=1 Tax=Cokeromyces recurvatus TaxID=90255 RepID=UPI0022204A22|nr:uncharacterized protein BX663DRAFT_492830 [Cokeromyces recurvatus]KAI7908056.1 hypothetical protein BX663DRAFT_492830 [Cokeromyces recurvatus]